MPEPRKPKKKEPEPRKVQSDAAEAWSILASLKRPFANRDAKWPIRRRVRNAEEEPPVPEAYSGTAIRHKSRELDWLVRQITALLGDNREQYIVYAPRDTEEMQKLADECQQAIAALMELLEDQYPMGRPRDIAHDRQTADGLAIEKITFNWDFFKHLIDTKGTNEDWQEAFERFVRENRELPFRRVPVDPLTCYWEYDIDGLTAIAEYGQVRLSALKETYKDDAHIINIINRIPVPEGVETGRFASNEIRPYGTSLDAGDTVTCIELWTRSEFWLLVEAGDGSGREVLVRRKHPFKRPPYFFAPGIVTGSPDPLYQFQPLVNPLYQTTLELSLVRTARFNAAYLSSFKPFYIQYDSGGVEMDEESGALKIHFLTPGNTIPSLKGGRIVPIDWTNLNELVQLEASLMSDRDRFGFQSILAGQAPSGESTAWATRMLRDQGMIQFNGVLRNYAQMREEEIRFIMDFCRDVLKMDLPIARRVVGPDGKPFVKVLKLTKQMVNAGFDIQVRVSANKATDRIAIVEEFRRAHEAGEVPLRMVLEEGWGFNNASQIMAETLDEKIRQAMLPQLVELAFQIGVTGALEALREKLPEQALPDLEGNVPGGGAAGPVQPPAPIREGVPPSGEIPGGIVEPGMGQGLVPPELPPEAPTAPMGPQGPVV
jgi:hypothetical protein